MDDISNKIVEVDLTRLSKEGFYLMGVRDALSQWTERLKDLSPRQPNKGVGQVLGEIAEVMAHECDTTAERLTVVALRDKSATINNIRADETS